MWMTWFGMKRMYKMCVYVYIVCLWRKNGINFVACANADRPSLEWGGGGL